MARQRRDRGQRRGRRQRAHRLQRGHGGTAGSWLRRLRGCAGCIGCVGCVNCVGCVGCVGLEGRRGRGGRGWLTARSTAWTWAAPRLPPALIDGARVTDESEQPTDLSGSDALLDEIARGGRRPDRAPRPARRHRRGPALADRLRRRRGGLQREHPARRRAGARAARAPLRRAGGDRQRRQLRGAGRGGGGGRRPPGDAHAGHRRRRRRGARRQDLPRRDGLGGRAGPLPGPGRRARLPRQLPRPGCLEALCSGTALRARRDRGRQERARTPSWAVRYADDGLVTGREAVEAAQRGDAHRASSCSTASGTTWAWASPAS